MTKIHEAKSATVKDDVLGKESSLKGLLESASLLARVRTHS